MAKQKKEYDLKTGGSGPEACPTGDHGGVGKPGNQNTPGIEHVELAPSDAKQFDQFGHKVK